MAQSDIVDDLFADSMTGNFSPSLIPELPVYYNQHKSTLLAESLQLPDVLDSNDDVFNQFLSLSPQHMQAHILEVEEIVQETSILESWQQCLENNSENQSTEILRGSLGSSTNQAGSGSQHDQIQNVLRDISHKLGVDENVSLEQSVKPEPVSPIASKDTRNDFTESSKSESQAIGGSNSPIQEQSLDFNQPSGSSHPSVTHFNNPSNRIHHFQPEALPQGLRELLQKIKRPLIEIVIVIESCYPGFTRVLKKIGGLLPFLMKLVNLIGSIFPGLKPFMQKIRWCLIFVFELIKITESFYQGSEPQSGQLKNGNAFTEQAVKSGPIASSSTLQEGSAAHKLPVLHLNDPCGVVPCGHVVELPSIMPQKSLKDEIMKKIEVLYEFVSHGCFKSESKRITSADDLPDIKQHNTLKRAYVQGTIDVDFPQRTKMKVDSICPSFETLNSSSNSSPGLVVDGLKEQTPVSNNHQLPSSKNFTEAEIEILISGAEEYGAGNWQMIKDNCFKNSFRKARQLQDKWKSLVKASLDLHARKKKCTVIFAGFYRRVQDVEKARNSEISKGHE